MRRRIAEQLARTDSDALLTTGEAAAVLGVSRQHVVDLCNAGELAFTIIGTHRRVRRGDVDLLSARQRRLSREERRSLLLAFAVAGHVVVDPVESRARARDNLQAMGDTTARGATEVWRKEWERLIDAPLPELLTALTSLSPRSRELRQNSPFAGVLSESERDRVLSVAANQP